MSPGRAACVIVVALAGTAHAEEAAEEAEEPSDEEMLELAEESDGEVIVVTGKPPDLAEPTTYTLGAEHVRTLPGSGNDVLRAAQSVPGVGRVAYGLGALVLRGTNPHDANVFLDGIEVPLAFHFGGLSSFYPSTLLDHLKISPGGAGVEYGRNVGGVVELVSRAPRRDRWRIGAEIGILDASVYTEGPTRRGGAIAIGVRRSYADAILAAVLPPEEMVLPRYYDSQIRWDLPLAGGTLSTLLFFSYDQVKVIDEWAFSNWFARGALRYRKRTGATTWTATPWAGLNSIGIDYSSEEEGDGSLRSGREPFGLRADVSRLTRWGELAAGIDVLGARVGVEVPEVDLDEEMPAMGSTIEHLWYADAGLWAEARWRIADGKLTVKPGLRGDYFGGIDRWTLDPRGVVTHELTSWLTLRETLGLHHQPPSGVWRFEADSLYAGVVTGVHGSVGVQMRLPAQWHGSATGFHVSFDGPRAMPEVEEEPVEESPSTGGGGVATVLIENLLGEELYPSLPGRGRASGVEISMQKRTQRWLMWLAYTLSRSERHAGPVSLDGWVPYDLDQTHNLNAVASVQLGGWQLGARFRWATGFPYTEQLGVMVAVDGTQTPIAGPTNAERLDDFLSVDLRVDRRWRRRWGTLAVFLDVQNITNARNPEGIGYDEAGQANETRGLPIFPMFGVMLTPPD